MPAAATSRTASHLHGHAGRGKDYVSFKLEVANKGGHSSVPTGTTPSISSPTVCHASPAAFPLHLVDVTRAAFERGANIYPGQLGADSNHGAKSQQRRRNRAPLRHSLLQRPDAHHLCRDHALRRPRRERAPQLASAVVNCRLLPIEKLSDIKRTLEQVLDDPESP